MAQVQVYRSSKVLGTAAVAACATVAVLGGAVLEQQPLLGWVLVVSFVAGGLAALAAQVAGGTTLSLGRKGLEISSLYTHRRIRWDDIQPPALVDLGKARFIGIRWRPGRGKPGVLRALLGVDLAIAPVYGVPLAAVCERMNTCRIRALATGLGADSMPATSIPAAPRTAMAATPARAAGASRPVRPYPVALGAALLVFGLNIVGRLALQLHGMPVTIAMAFGAAALVAIWFGWSVGRPPTPQERTRFLWAYGALIALPMLALYGAAAISRGFDGAGLAILALHAIAYPAAAQFFLADKRIAGLVHRGA